MSRRLQPLFPFRSSEKKRKEFYSILSHLYRTPLSSAGGYLDLLLQGYAGRLDCAQRRYLSQSRDALQQLRRVSDAFLDILAFELGIVPRCSEPTDIAAALRGAREELRAWASSEGRRVFFEVPRAPLRVRLDPKWFQVLLEELFSNALRVSPRKSRIDIRLEAERDSALLTVGDRGPGVPRNQTKRIFDPLVQLRGPGTPPCGERGGMGLALGDRVVRVCRGRLWAGKHPGGGLAVMVRLPLALPSR